MNTSLSQGCKIFVSPEWTKLCRFHKKT